MTFSNQTVQCNNLYIPTSMYRKGYLIMNDTLILLGKRIAYLRNKRGFTQEKLAEMVDYSTNHISKLELARTNPSFELLVNLANALNIELKELFNFDEYQSTKYIKKEFEKLLHSSEEKKLKLLYKIYQSLDN